MLNSLLCNLFFVNLISETFFALFLSGCKIKALRAKTNTYIKTPVRGEEPVFVVTGRKEDVSKAKREILSAAEHFSLIRASRKPSLNGGSGEFMFQIDSISFSRKIHTNFELNLLIVKLILTLSKVKVHQPVPQQMFLAK